MVALLKGLRQRRFSGQPGWRLINSKYPTVNLIDDIASEADFDDLYAVAGLTNPRLLDELDKINLIPRGRRPFGIRGASYAVGPFVHLNPLGSRFTQPGWGAFYCADSIEVAISETRYHQERYLRGVGQLAYDDIQMRGLKVTFSARLYDITAARHDGKSWYDPDDYAAARQLGDAVKAAEGDGIFFKSVRHPGGKCYALFFPDLIGEVIQTSHYNYRWDGHAISDVYKISRVR